MDLHRMAAGLVVAGFEPLEIPKDTKDLIAQGLRGVILFRRNVESALQISSLCAALKREAGRPFLMSVDQEGGRVARLREGFTALPPMRRIGEANDEALARDCGKLLARECRAAGFDVDFAPVLDVDTNPANPVIGDRAFSREAEVVARLGVALAQGMEEEGVASCGKHFPGHGDTSTDSHHTLPRLPHAMERLRQVELVPFAAYAKAGLASLMTAHVVFEAVDPGVPATFSHKVQTGLVRGELGFEGVLVSDDLEMRAIADRYGMEEAAVRSVAAGVDMVLVCHRADRQQEVIDALAKEAGKSQAFRARMEEAHGRVEAMARRFVAPPADPKTAVAAMASAEHQGLAARVRSAEAVGVDPTEVTIKIS